MMMAKKTQAANPRSVSVIYGGDENYRQNGGLDDLYDDPAEDKIKLMMDIKRLDEDVLEGLIRGLKIPSPTITNPAAVKEILFPSNLISLTTNEMWRYGLIQESERFLASVLQAVQTHVMVRMASSRGKFSWKIKGADRVYSRSPERMRSFREFSGFPTSTRCSPSFA
jgi:myosin-5